MPGLDILEIEGWDLPTPAPLENCQHIFKHTLRTELGGNKYGRDVSTIRTILVLLDPACRGLDIERKSPTTGHVDQCVNTRLIQVAACRSHADHVPRKFSCAFVFCADFEKSILSFGALGERLLVVAQGLT